MDEFVGASFLPHKRFAQRRAPGTNIDSASGGVVTSTIGTPRNVQFALKLIF